MLFAAEYQGQGSESGLLFQGQTMKGYLSVERFKTVIKPTRIWSAFYHHTLVIQIINVVKYSFLEKNVKMCFISLTSEYLL